MIHHAKLRKRSVFKPRWVRLIHTTSEGINLINCGLDAGCEVENGWFSSNCGLGFRQLQRSLDCSRNRRIDELAPSVADHLERQNKATSRVRGDPCLQAHLSRLGRANDRL